MLSSRKGEFRTEGHGYLRGWEWGKSSMSPETSHLRSSPVSPPVDRSLRTQGVGLFLRSVKGTRPKGMGIGGRGPS